MTKPSNPQETVTELIRRGMHRGGWDSRQITNALKLWKSFSPKIAENLQQPALWAAAVELAVARLELENEEIKTKIARKYGVEHREVKAKCDEIWRQLNIQPFDPRFCSLPQILADMIMGDEELKKEMELLAAQGKKKKQKKTEPEPSPDSYELPPPQLDDYVEALIEDPENAYSESDHIADLALDWREEHDFPSTHKLLTRLINHFGSLPQDGLNVEITADALVALGEVLQEEKQVADALPLFRRAADIHGSYPGALDDLAESHFALGQYVEAIIAWREEIEIETDCAHCYHRIADVYEKLGQTADKVATLEELVSRQPKEIVARDRLRVHWLAAGNTDAADTCRKETLAVRAPSGIDGITIWVKYQLDAGRSDACLQFLHRFEQELSEHIEVRIYILKAIVFLASDQTEEAQNEVRRARSMPNFCEHCWIHDLEIVARRFGNNVAEQIRRLAAST